MSAPGTSDAHGRGMELLDAIAASPSGADPLPGRWSTPALDGYSSGRVAIAAIDRLGDASDARLDHIESAGVVAAPCASLEKAVAVIAARSEGDTDVTASRSARLLGLVEYETMTLLRCGRFSPTPFRSAPLCIPSRTFRAHSRLRSEWSGRDAR